jgi:DNA repair protein SbcC/Rad50
MPTVVANQKGLEYLYQYLDVKNATRKTPKVIKSHPDITVDRDPLTFEDSTINQYFLDESKKVFEKSLEEHQKSAKTKDIALRRALRDTIEVTNNLYRSYFEFDTVLDDGFFRQFIKATPKEALEDVKEKARIARIIRETKEVDYKNAIRLEKKFLAELSKREKDVIRDESKSIREKADTEAEELIDSLKASTHDEEQAMLAEHMAYVSEQNREMLELHKNTDLKISEDLKAIKEQEELAIAQEKEKARIRFEREQARLRLKLEREKKRLKDKKTKAAQKERERERARMAKARAQSKTRVTKAKKTLETSNAAKLKKLQDKIDTLKGEGDGNT